MGFYEDFMGALPQASCPTCKGAFDRSIIEPIGFQNVHEELTEGDPLVCHNCGEILLYDAGSFRMPSPEELIMVVFRNPLILGAQRLLRARTSMDV